MPNQLAGEKENNLQICPSCGCEMTMLPDALMHQCAGCGHRLLGQPTPPTESLGNLCAACLHPISPEHDDFGCHIEDCACTVTGAAAAAQIAACMGNAAEREKAMEDERANAIDESKWKDQGDYNTDGGCVKCGWGAPGTGHSSGYHKEGCAILKKERQKFEHLQGAERRNAAGVHYQCSCDHSEGSHVQSGDKVSCSEPGCSCKNKPVIERSNANQKFKCSKCGEIAQSPDPDEIVEKCPKCGGAMDFKNANGRRYRFKDQQGEIIEVQAMTDDEAWAKLADQMAMPQSDIRAAGVKMLSNSIAKKSWFRYPDPEVLERAEGIGIEDFEDEDLTIEGLQAKLAALKEGHGDQQTIAALKQRLGLSNAASREAFEAHTKECAGCANALESGKLDGMCEVGNKLLTAENSADIAQCYYCKKKIINDFCDPPCEAQKRAGERKNDAGFPTNPPCPKCGGRTKAVFAEQGKYKCKDCAAYCDRPAAENKNAAPKKLIPFKGNEGGGLEASRIGDDVADQEGSWLVLEIRQEGLWVERKNSVHIGKYKGFDIVQVTAEIFHAISPDGGIFCKAYSPEGCKAEIDLHYDKVDERKNAGDINDLGPAMGQMWDQASDAEKRRCLELAGLGIGIMSFRWSNMPDGAKAALARKVFEVENNLSGAGEVWDRSEPAARAEWLEHAAVPDASFSAKTWSEIPPAAQAQIARTMGLQNATSPAWHQAKEAYYRHYDACEACQRGEGCKIGSEAYVKFEQEQAKAEKGNAGTPEERLKAAARKVADAVDGGPFDQPNPLGCNGCDDIRAPLNRHGYCRACAKEQGRVNANSWVTKDAMAAAGAAKYGSRP